MADRVIQRNDTTARWQSINPVLAQGELGIVSDGAKGYKIGDGVTAWNNLEYPANPASIVQELGDSETAVISQKGVTDTFNKIGLLYHTGLETFYEKSSVYIDTLWKCDTSTGLWTSLVVNNRFDLPVERDSCFLVVTNDFSEVLIRTYGTDIDPDKDIILLVHSKTQGFTNGVLFHDYCCKEFGGKNYYSPLGYTIAETGRGINYNGDVIAATNYMYTQPFQLKRGDKVKIQVKGYELGVLCFINPDGTYYPILSNQVLKDSQVVSNYEYTIKQEGSYACSAYVNSLKIWVNTRNRLTKPNFTAGAIAGVRLPSVNPSILESVNLNHLDSFIYNGDTLYTPASITKVMSLIVASDYIKDPTERITVLSEDITSGSGNNLLANDILSWRDLFLDAMLPSSNSATKCIARTVGALILSNEGKQVTSAASVTRFVEEMNIKAKLIGMTNTHFDEPCGYPTTETQKLTVKDALKMVVYASSIKSINDAWSQKKATLTVYGANSRTISIVNDVSEEHTYGPYLILGGKPGQISQGSTATGTWVAILYSTKSGNSYGIAAIQTQGTSVYKQFSTVTEMCDYLDSIP